MVFLFLHLTFSLATYAHAVIAANINRATGICLWLAAAGDSGDDSAHASARATGQRFLLRADKTLAAQLPPRPRYVATHATAQSLPSYRLPASYAFARHYALGGCSALRRACLPRGLPLLSFYRLPTWRFSAGCSAAGYATYLFRFSTCSAPSTNVWFAYRTRLTITGLPTMSTARLRDGRDAYYSPPRVCTWILFYRYMPLASTFWH